MMLMRRCGGFVTTKTSHHHHQHASIIRRSLVTSNNINIGPNKKPTSISSSSSDEVPVEVEISPNNHGTRPLQSLLLDDAKRLDPSVVQQLKKNKFVKPTPIQAHALPLLLRGHDVMASAPTGSGKSLLFCLPLVQRLLRNSNHTSSSKNGRPRALVLNPTRELALQTAQVLQQLLTTSTSTSSPSLNIALATGGASTSQQRKQIPLADVVVGTPGRVQQFLDERVLCLQDCTYTVIDEADRLLDLGFEPQLTRIARSLPKQHEQQRQTILCSATFPSEVQRLGSLFLRPEYYFCAVGKVGGMHQNIAQTLLWAGDCNSHQRRSKVLHQVTSFLRSNNNNNNNNNKQKQQRVIVFCNTKDEAERMGAALKKEQQQYTVRVVTGDKDQSERNRSLEAFRRGTVQILVATDVASRGIDVPQVGLVIQADAPRDVDTFVHRVGRTGRGAGHQGRATALLDGRSQGMAVDLADLLHRAQQTVPAWLTGMAHVARAKRLEEEGAIAAGGGGGGDNGSDLLNPPPLPAETNQQQHVFTGQDFRSSAKAGSWGSERDTSFYSFDEEAYSSLEMSDTSITVVEESVSSTQFNIESTDSVESNQLVKDDTSQIEEVAAVATRQTEVLPFTRPSISRELKDALRRITGSLELSEIPRREVLNALSKKGADQRLRFEYIGSFPFESVVELLSRKDSKWNNSSGSSLPKVLMVAEKPSIAKAIADALSGPRGPRQRRGISRALPVYEFTSDSFSSATDDPLNTSGGSRVLCIVTSVVGHIFSLGFSEETDDNGIRRRLDPVEYFGVPVAKQEESTTGKLRVIDHLRALAAECNHLVLWLDCDAEGENIAFETIGVTRRAFEQKVADEKAANPNGQPLRRIHRAHFSAITGDALRDAFRNLGEPDAALSRSVDARQELDLRVGVAITRLLTWRCVGLARKKYSPSTKLISYGPCQTPTLSFCIDRAREIQAFVPKKYWKVHTRAHQTDNPRISYEIKWKATDPVESTTKQKTGYLRRSETGVQYEESATFDEKSAADVVRLASRPGCSLRVSQVEAVTERVSAPVGLNTVALLSAGSKSMGMSPKQVMNVAEKLYSAGFISYPRTETTRYDPKGFDVRSMLREHSSHPDWGRTASHLLRTKYSNSGRPPIRGKDAGDHPPITCLRSATRDEVGGGAAWRVYDFVVRNMLGSFSDDLFFTRTIAQMEFASKTAGSWAASNQSPAFELEEVSVDSLGFAGACTWVLKDIGAQQKDGMGRDNVAMVEGMTLCISDIRCELCQTKPPRFLQEHELIQLMDMYGVGTDASMATHVNNIVDRGYVVLCDETGTELRPPRPPRPGQPRPPRQIGRYLVPTPLGMSLMDLFDPTSVTTGNSVVRPQGLDDDEQAPSSVGLLARPAIRAQMETECKQIALGELDKETCLSTNLNWFKMRYEELEKSLTRNMLQQRFAPALRPAKEGLRFWRQFGAFESPRKASSVGTNNHDDRNGKKKTSYQRKHRRRGSTEGKKRVVATVRKERAEGR